MKVLLTAFLALSFIISGCSSLSKTDRSDYKLRPYKQVQLKNGMPVLLIEDKSLPYFSLVMLLNTGSSSDPKGKAGLTSLVASLLDQGTKNRKALEIADSLGQIGAEFGVSVDHDYTLISGSSLSFHQDKLLADFSEIVTDPSFSNAEVERMRKQVLSTLQRTVDDPSQFASVMYSDYLYGEHPYADRSLGEIDDVKKIKRKDIIRFYLTHFRPHNATLAVVGNFNEAEILSKLEERFKGWSSQRKLKPVEFPAMTAVDGVQIQLINKEDLAQSQVRLGHLGIKRSNPDYLKLKVANVILGGTFNSRLIEEIRVKRGLTYSISSSMDARKDQGPFVIGTFTRHDKVGETVKETLNVLSQIKEKGVTEQEVKDAKELLKGVFPRSLETAEGLATSLLVLKHYGVSDDYLDNYLDNVEDIDVGDVNEVIKKYYHPDKIKVLVYGPEKQVRSQLEPLGNLSVKSYRDYL